MKAGVKPHVTELPFCVGIVHGCSTAPSAVFSQPYGKKRPFGVLFVASRVNTYSESHVPILTWPGMTSSLTSHGSLMTSLNILLKLVSRTIIWYEKGPLETSIENFKGEQILWKFAIYFNWCVLQKHNTNENISADMCPSQFYLKNTITFDLSDDVDARFVHRVL